MTTDLDILRLNPGDLIRHIKRGSVYEVMGYNHAHPDALIDNRSLPVWIKWWDGKIMAMVQRNTRNLPNPCMTILYRAVEPKIGDPWMFIRPVSEFTSDRFEKFEADQP